MLRMIDFALRSRIRDTRYEPISVWVQDPGPGPDRMINFPPGNADMAIYQDLLATEQDD